jgi:putative transposase
MPRTARATHGGYCYHVLDRGNARRTILHKDGDYAAFVKLLRQAGERTPIRLICYCLMPNHFHLVVWPIGDTDLSIYMQWLMTAHVRRYHRHYHSTGHVWQGRFKVFPIQEDLHLLTVLRYVERNAVRAGLVELVEDWRYSSAAPRLITDPELYAGPVQRPPDWLRYVNEPQTEAEVKSLRQCVQRGRPYGAAPWMVDTAQVLGIESSLRPRGRPRKTDTERSLFDELGGDEK